MTAKLVYNIHRTKPLADPDADWEWILIRAGLVERGAESLGFLPEVDVAVFTSEVEARLFQSYLGDLQKKAQERCA